jgi:hypothetical protein
MAAGKTYEPIATQTLGSAQTTITFGSISGSYTDLVLVANWAQSAVGSCSIRFNSDSGSNYSFTELRGNGSAASSTRLSNAAQSWWAYNVFPDTSYTANAIISIQNYSNATTYKTFLSRANANSGSFAGTSAIVGLWRSTSAITSIELDIDGSATYNTGSTFTLYGISAA